MRPRHFRALLQDEDCRREMLSAIGQHLRASHAERTEPLPERLQQLLQRLTGAEERVASSR